MNPYEAEQVKKIYEWYLEGASLKTITDRLQEAGYTNRYGSYSSWSSVRNILENETYLGRIHFGDVLVCDAHEPLVTEEQFNKVQALRGRRREQYGTWAFQSKHLLTGMLYCGHCGGRYYLRNSGKYKYYSCYSRTKQIKNMIKDPNCKNRHWKGSELEPLIDAKILSNNEVNDSFGFVERPIVNSVVLLTNKAFRATLLDVNILDGSKPEEVALLPDFEM